MNRSSEITDLNQWVYRDVLVADPLSHQVSAGSTNRNISVQAARRSELVRALAERKAARQARAPRSQHSLLARLRLALVGPAV